MFSHILFFVVVVVCVFFPFFFCSYFRSIDVFCAGVWVGCATADADDVDDIGLGG